MNFEFPWLLLLLLLTIPGLLLWQRSVRKRQERIRRFSENAFTGRLIVGYNPKLRMWHFVLFFSGCALLMAAISEPKVAGGKEKVKLTGIDIIVVLDISNSMRATDFQPSRLERTKLALQQIIPTMGEDRIGMVVFAGRAYTNLPLSDDHGSAQMVLESVSPDMISMQGTAIGAAVEQAMASFRNTEDVQNQDRGRAIIVISDGENHEDDAATAAKKAAEKGVIVCTIGVGSPAGATIPEYDEKGTFTGTKRDMDGNEIVTRLNESTLQEMAREGKGIYVRATPSDMGLSRVYASLQGLNKSTKETWRYKEYTHLFPWLAALAILLLMVEPLLPEGKRHEHKHD